MDWLNKLPRPILISIVTASLTVSGLLVTATIKNSYAEIDKTKVVAYQAKKIAEQTQMQYAELRGAVQELAVRQENNRKENREDMKEIQQSLNQLLHDRRGP